MIRATLILSALVAIGCGHLPAQQARSPLGAPLGTAEVTAIAGGDLNELRHAVEEEFLAIDQQEQTVRTAMARLETGFVRRFMDFQHG